MLMESTFCTNVFKKGASTDMHKWKEETRSSRTEPAHHISYLIVSGSNTLPWDKVPKSTATESCHFHFQAIYNAQPDPSKDSRWRKSGF